MSAQVARFRLIRTPQSVQAQQQAAQRRAETGGAEGPTSARRGIRGQGPAAGGRTAGDGGVRRQPD